MKAALVIGSGQIGSEIAAQLIASGTDVRIATRSGGGSSITSAGAANAHAPSETSSTTGMTTVSTPTHLKADASDRAQLTEAAAGVEAIFACAHAPYDSRIWEQILPRLDAAILDTAAEIGIPVVFPESVYAFAGLHTPITETSPFAPVEDKGHIRQQLIEARDAHSATGASVIAGDLLGRTAEKWSSVVRMCITEPISAGRRAMVPARTDVPHGITVIADHAAAMIRVAEDLKGVPAGTHQLRIAPASNPTLAEIADFTADTLGQKHKRPLSVPRWATRAIGAFERSFYELNQLAPIWYEPCVITPGDLAAEVGTTDWRAGVTQMLRAETPEIPAQQPR
ncbi:Nucleoside-diphosphate-sugar epimerase [Brevibacterium siliguriense]|uniref:Nucleoside-diphosphate-sugar epimerase n=1 Tax=Brevibacterium siliguriense TaxID=1136497 RepID=A0A1H1SHU4_9MICO|nr:NAD-dependent epimerase/dehydratase family protein [Brevibacterium siliguriense]SDS47555.1 Nucleoside-diphosphate-sugar epimerase [Brevibacterium siliguriense]